MAVWPLDQRCLCCQCLPIIVDAGCSRKEVRDDPFYLGIRSPRLEGGDYVDVSSSELA